MEYFAACHFALFLHIVTLVIYCAGSLSSELRILQVSDTWEHLVIWRIDHLTPRDPRTVAPGLCTAPEEFQCLHNTFEWCRWERQTCLCWPWIQRTASSLWFSSSCLWSYEVSYLDILIALWEEYVCFGGWLPPDFSITCKIGCSDSWFCYYQGEWHSLKAVQVSRDFVIAKESFSGEYSTSYKEYCFLSLAFQTWPDLTWPQ